MRCDTSKSVLTTEENLFTQTESRESMRVTPLGFCLRVIVNEKTLNLEKTTYSVMSVIVN